MRQIVLRLIGLPKALAARAVRSASDWRLSGTLLSETVSQAMALTVAWSKGGKGGLAASPGQVVQGEVFRGPTPPPATDLWVGQPDGLASCAMAEVGVFMQEEGQAGPLDEAMRRRPPADGITGVLQEFLGELRAECGCRPWHAARPCRLANEVGQQAKAL
jgi:hypothetical protein